MKVENVNYVTKTNNVKTKTLSPNNRLTNIEREVDTAANISVMKGSTNAYFSGIEVNGNPEYYKKVTHPWSCCNNNAAIEMFCNFFCAICTIASPILI